MTVEFEDLSPRALGRLKAWMETWFHNRAVSESSGGGGGDDSNAVHFNSENVSLPTRYLSVTANDSIPGPFNGAGYAIGLFAAVTNDDGDAKSGLSLQTAGDDGQVAIQNDSTDGGVIVENTSAGFLDSGDSIVKSIRIRNDGAGLLEIRTTGDDGLLVQNDGDGATEIKHNGDGGTLIRETGDGGITIEDTSTGGVNIESEQGDVNITSEVGLVVINSQFASGAGGVTIDNHSGNDTQIDVDAGGNLLLQCTAAIGTPGWVKIKGDEIRMTPGTLVAIIDNLGVLSFEQDADSTTIVRLQAGKKLEVQDSTGNPIFRVNENGDLQGKTGKALTFNL